MSEPKIKGNTVGKLWQAPIPEEYVRLLLASIGLYFQSQPEQTTFLTSKLYSPAHIENRTEANNDIIFDPVPVSTSTSSVELRGGTRQAI